MGRQPCCAKVGLKRGPWSVEEDRKLVTFISRHGHGCWREVPKLAGLLRCGKSCRLRWTNYLRPDLKRGQLSDAEEKLIIDLHAAIGNRWSRIAAQLPGRTDNEIKNYWNTRIKKKLKHMGIDPHTHEPLFEIVDKESKTAVSTSSTPTDILHAGIATTTNLLHKQRLSSIVGCTYSCDMTVSPPRENMNEGSLKELSKRERMEIESREAHMKVEKMRAALHAFNSRSPSASIISSANSIVTHPYHSHKSTESEEYSSESSSTRFNKCSQLNNSLVTTKIPSYLAYTHSAHLPGSHSFSDIPVTSYQSSSHGNERLQSIHQMEYINDLKPFLSVHGNNQSGTQAVVPNITFDTMGSSQPMCEHAILPEWTMMEDQMPASSTYYVDPSCSVPLEHSSTAHYALPQSHDFKRLDETTQMASQQPFLNPLFRHSFCDASMSTVMMQLILDEASTHSNITSSVIADNSTSLKIPALWSIMCTSYEDQRLVGLLDNL